MSGCMDEEWGRDLWGGGAAAAAAVRAREQRVADRKAPRVEAPRGVQPPRLSELRGPRGPPRG